MWRSFKISTLGLVAGAGFCLIGFVQPTLMHLAYTGVFTFSLGNALLSCLFSATFVAILIVLHLVLRRFEPDSKELTVAEWYDGIARHRAPILTSVARVGLSVSLVWVSFKYVRLIYADGILTQTNPPFDLFTYPKIIDRVVPFFDLGPLGYQVMVLTLAGAAVLGLRTRVTFPLLWVLTWYLVSHYEATRNFWSHGAVPILMTGLPLLFHDLRGKYYVRLWARGGEPEAPYLPLFLAQTFAALFFAGAFLAKMVTGGLAWMVSDHIRNSYHFSWSGLTKDVSQPIWMEFVLSDQLIVAATSFGHLLMQVLPVLVIMYPLSKVHRNFEGLAYAAACVLLWAFMGFIWPWYWWLGVAALFFNYDSVAVGEQNPRTEPLSAESWYGLKYVFVAVYVFGFTTQFPAVRLNLYPFMDALNFYALPYDTYPFDSKVAQVLKTNGLTLEAPNCLATAKCILEQRRMPHDQNSPVNQAVSNFEPAQKLRFLEWCRQHSGTFCSGDPEKDTMIWSGFFNMDKLGLPPVFVGATALRTKDGGDLAIAADEAGSAVSFVGTLAGTVSAVEFVELSADRTHMTQVSQQKVEDPARIVLPETRSCLTGVIVTFGAARTVPFVGAVRCSWRKK